MSDLPTEQLETESAATPTPTPRPPNRLLLWGVSAAVICAFLTLDFATPWCLINGIIKYEWVFPILLGVFIGEVNLIAFWAALGPGNIVARIPWSLLLGTAMWYALLLGFGNIGNFSRADAIVLGAILLGGMIIAQIPLWIAKLVFRWRLVDPSGRFPTPQEERQFNIRHLLMAMFLVSVALSPARTVLPQGPFEINHIGFAEPLIYGIFIALSLLVTIPCIWGTFVAEAPGTIVVLLFGLPIYCIVLAVGEFVAITVLTGGPQSRTDGREFFNFWLFVLTPGLTVFGTLLIYRAMGFRLIRRPRVLLADIVQEGRGEGEEEG